MVIGRANWHVVYTKPRQEQLAVENLQRQSYDIYLPHMQLQKRRGTQRQLVTEVMFPRYLFCQLTPGEDSFSPIRSTRGVVDLVRFGGTVATVPDDLIASLRVYEQHAMVHDAQAPRFKSGDRVVILEGPFAGYEAVFKQAKPQDRAIVLLQIAERHTQVQLQQQALERAE